MSAESFLDGRVILHAGDSRDVLKTLADNSVDAFVGDPPYALVSIVKRFGNADSAPVKIGDINASNDLKAAYARQSAGFMGRKWDTGETAFDPAFWTECLRVLKPGGHVAMASGTRTYHQLASAIELAGFEIRDSILEMMESESAGIAFLDSLNDAQRSAFIRLLDEQNHTGLLGWCYGSGFPKSHDIAKNIDKAERGVPHGGADPTSPNHGKFKGGCSEDNKLGQGFGAGPGQFMAEAGIKVGRELSDTATEWQGWGTALKPAWEPIVLARKPLSEKSVAANVLRWGTGAINIDGCRVGVDAIADASQLRTMSRNVRDSGDGWGMSTLAGDQPQVVRPDGRWPANLLHDGSDEVLAEFPDSDGQQFATGPEYAAKKGTAVYGDYGARPEMQPRGDSGSAARFFYTAKADADDRLGSKHPTVKPVDLMQWLVRLVTPKGGTCLDPFAGTGTTAEAAFREGMSCILIERESEYQVDIRRRMSLVMSGPEERKRESIKAKGEIPFEAGSLFADREATE